MAFWIKYHCNTCGADFDGLHYKNDEAPYDCKECGSADTKALEAYQNKAPGTWNKEVCFGSPVKSPVDGKHYSSRKQWDNHLKANQCHEVGNDPAGYRKHEGIRGDFDTKKDIAQVLNKMGI